MADPCLVGQNTLGRPNSQWSDNPWRNFQNVQEVVGLAVFVQDYEYKVNSLMSDSELGLSVDA